jgi:hypothetical protein
MSDRSNRWSILHKTSYSQKMRELGPIGFLSGRWSSCGTNRRIQFFIEGSADLTSLAATGWTEASKSEHLGGLRVRLKRGDIDLAVHETDGNHKLFASVLGPCLHCDQASCEALWKETSHATDRGEETL